jgi:hypothetical protein
MEGETTPWYASARLFRQRRAGDWDEVMARVAAALAGLARSHAEGVHAEVPNAEVPNAEVSGSGARRPL